MRKCLIFLHLLFVLPLVLEAAPQDAMPKVLFDDENRSPVGPAWVDRSIACDDEGHFDVALFPPQRMEFLEDFFRKAHRNDDGCPMFGRLYLDFKRSYRNNLAESVRNAGWVFTAEVTGLSLGFRGAFPGTLVRINVDRQLKGEVPHLGAHYFYLWRAAFPAGSPGRACVDDKRYPDVPNVGDRVLLVLEETRSGLSPFGALIGTDQYSGIVTFPGGDRVSAPSIYISNEKATESPEAFVAWIEALISDQEGR